MVTGDLPGCATCGGTGTTSGVNCATCGGTGAKPAHHPGTHVYRPDGAAPPDYSSLSPHQVYQHLDNPPGT